MQNIEKKKLWKKIILLLIVLFVGFVFFEVVLRITWPIQNYGYPNGLHTPDETKGYKYQPNFVGKFPGEMYKDIEIKINGQGLRDYEHSYEKDSGIIRILGLGDSVTFGSGVEYENTYLRQLENKFSENNYRVEIIKAGINGYEFDQEYTYFFEEGYRYNPDIVIIGIVLNDARPVNVSKIKESYNNNKKPFFPRIRSIVKNTCFTCRFVYTSLINIHKKAFNKKDYNQLYFEGAYNLWQGESWEYYKTKLLKLNSYLEENDIELVLVIFPYTQQFAHSLNYGREPQNKISALAKSNDITVINLVPYLDLEDFERYYLFEDNVHLNKDGYGLVKEVIYSELINTKQVVKGSK